MSNKVSTGDSFKSNSGEVCTVTKYMNTDNVEVSFLGYPDFTLNTSVGSLRRGKFKNPYRPRIFGVGFVGVGEYNTATDSRKTYKIWYGILERCYCEKSLSKYPTYLGCYVAKEWHNFQNFAEWYTTHEYFGLGYHIDKDILLQGNKVYCPEYCCLVPSAINQVVPKNFLSTEGLATGFSKTKTGRFRVVLPIQGKNISVGMFDSEQEALEAYRLAKRFSMISMAKEYKSQISEEVYFKLVNWNLDGLSG